VTGSELAPRPCKTSTNRFDLGGFVLDGASNLHSEIWWKLGHAMRGARVFGALFQDFLLGLTFCDEVAVNSDVSTTDCLCHPHTSQELGEESSTSAEWRQTGAKAPIL
jgi:hypothetical protein